MLETLKNAFLEKFVVNVLRVFRCLPGITFDERDEFLQLFDKIYGGREIWRRWDFMMEIRHNSKKKMTNLARKK